jgi:hypothetical protein
LGNGASDQQGRAIIAPTYSKALNNREAMDADNGLPLYSVFLAIVQAMPSQHSAPAARIFETLAQSA